ncbi:hypothetical protein EW026_g4962 [Hermanssonia centrifuga]|uniref:Uncharacterized protein n=1 Tax=Hermanssonia centrifuga TaxID=98765 RepID=A0A4S4KGJ2_9APHY|nr:hypothetical protein EW026_g4962 [Hermanssonia centrifuga]
MLTLEEGIFKDTRGFLGIAGNAHLTFLIHNCHHYADVEPTLLPSPGNFRATSSFPQAVISRATSTPFPGKPSSDRREEQSGSTATQLAVPGSVQSSKPGTKQPGHASISMSLREKFTDFQHPLMPPGCPIWVSALAKVDFSRPAPLGDNGWAFWLPEARLVIGSEMIDRQARYVMNWLRVRESWLYILTHHNMQDGVIGPLKAPQWREYLNTSARSQQEAFSKDTKKSLRKREVAAIFKRVFGVDDILEIQPPDEWFGRSLKNCTPEDLRLYYQQIAWELSELGFRYELLQLDYWLVPIDNEDPDRHLKENERRRLIAEVFPSDRDFVMGSLPIAVDSLAAIAVEARVPHLEALRQVLARWPDSPPYLQKARVSDYTSSVLRIEHIEMQMARFYCQCFYEIAGRAPALPRRFPLA